jgi:hypothetical protein
MHVTLARRLAERQEHHDAAMHLRKVLETYPGPLPEVPRFVTSTFRVLGRFVPSLREFDLDKVQQSNEARQAEAFDWAKSYLAWYDATFGEQGGRTKQ